MKKFFNFLILGLAVMGMNACNDDGQSIVLKDYVASVTILNKESGEVKIDNFIYQVDMELVEEQDRSDVRIRLELAEGATMVSPREAEAVYNLQSAATFSIAADGKTLTYKITASEIEEPAGTPYKGWAQCLNFGDLPSGIRVYKSPAQLQGKNAVAYIAVAKTSKGRTFDVIPSGTRVGTDLRSTQISGAKTPAQFYSDGNYPVIVNGGFFYFYTYFYNLSLIWRAGAMVFTTSLDVYIDGSSTPYYPTRGIFGHITGMTYQTDWAFTMWDGKTYAYPAPAPNPAIYGGSISPTYPPGGREYAAQTAIGGGPVLIKGGELATATMMEDEMTASNLYPNNPRTAIGYTNDRKLILFACEGRDKTPDTPGFTLTEMANILKDLGCVEALNLDGGGSSCMLVNGQETIKPSEGSQRAVTSAVILK
ncbi:MAG: phosphodiester glycosidase family protein [Prevotellaceae bacterium]|jgi:hypothetical protein|nr:phosphodiester glycosidase family protein [Prevotellaceae bacterium]